MYVLNKNYGSQEIRMSRVFHETVEIKKTGYLSTGKSKYVWSLMWLVRYVKYVN